MAETVIRTPARVRIGPEHNGRRMTFHRFQQAEPVDGFRYELASGVIEVTDVPGRIHELVLAEIERQLFSYHLANDGAIAHMMGAGRSKTEMPELQSERHPDYSVYLTPMPVDEYPWDKWTPTIVVEVVSPGRVAAKRDYQTKRREYLAAGIIEYWIVDPQTRSMLALTRHGDQWRENRRTARQSWTTPLLPGFKLELARTFSMLERPGSK